MRFLYTAVLWSLTFMVSGQTPSLHYKFRVYLKDKGSVGYSVDEPETFLTGQAIERKQRQDVRIDSLDFPISRDYFHLVGQVGGRVVSHSKWFKTMVVQVSDSVKIDDIRALPFVDSVHYVWRGYNRSYRNLLRPRLKAVSCEEDTLSGHYFGLTGNQFKLHNAANMAEAGFQGKGIRIGVIDAGFTNYDVIPYFENSRLEGFGNFVPTGELFSANDHGTKVLSAMAVNRPNRMMGSAPEARYWLLRSEDVTSEFPVEEDYWVRAVEYADSVGVDLINTSLGYSSFDDQSLNYSHGDLTGKFSFMSQAVDKAYEKGMLMIVSAGNEGNKPWGKITPPGDAKNVITVGAVGTDSVIASFSSHGPTADGRIKPDLVSAGRGTITIGQNGLIGMTNGTSLSSPFLTGLIASLWSVNPGLHRSEIAGIVKRSADRYLRPDSVYGYGIPDFGKAVKEVLQTLPIHDKGVSGSQWMIEPDSSGTGYSVKLVDPEFTFDAYSASMLDENGHLLLKQEFDETDSVQFSLSSKQREDNAFIYFMVDDPFVQHTYRIRL